MEFFIETIKPKVLFERENLSQIYKVVNAINRISELENKSRINYFYKCINFLEIKKFILLRLYFNHVRRKKYILD